MTELTPFALKDAPALIETVFPAQKVSFEAQKERKANLGQTLTGLGSYWKGRKPLILVRAVVLGSLLPQTDNTEKDLEIFEMLLAFDDQSLAKRALIQNLIKPRDIAEKINLYNPWDYFSHNIKVDDERFHEVDAMHFPFSSDVEGLRLRWRRDIQEQEKLFLLKETLKTFESYEDKAALCKRPEELDQIWLYEHVWPQVNAHYRHLGLEVFTHQNLTGQIGLLRYGCNPRIGDTFSGGGSIPFEAARLGCDVYASDLNPIACMLSWASLKIIQISKNDRLTLEKTQRNMISDVDHKITSLGIEHDDNGNRAKSYLYCIETVCPETGWKIPMAPSWIISKSRKTIAELNPDHQNKRFSIKVRSSVSDLDLKNASKGTVQDGNLIYELDGRTYRTPIKTLRGDYRDSEGFNRNQLRRWEKLDFIPRQADIFQERLYAVQWIEKNPKGKQTTFFASVTDKDLDREKTVENIVASNIQKWQLDGLIPDMAIEPGYNTDQPIRERGWGYWHQLFSARGILNLVLIKQSLKKSDKYLWPLISVAFARTLDFSSRLSYWESGLGKDLPGKVFSNQALNTWYSFGVRSSKFLLEKCFVLDLKYERFPILPISINVSQSVSSNIDSNSPIPIFITDPPYADAVHYHEITEFFIAWLRKNPPEPFDKWVWDSRRALAIKGSGDGFRKGMVNSYRAMADHMPDNGMQCVMFTHQDTGVWSDMIGIFWAAGLQVVGAWYIATETTSELKKGGYVQGTVILMLRKRPAGENAGFKQRLLPAVRAEVKHQIETMMHLNDEVKDKMGEPVFNDSDLQMAGYAAALKVLTSYTHIGGEDVTAFALRPRTKGEVTVVDEIVQQAAEAANSLLVPEGLSKDTWQKLSGIQRFYLRMMDMETTGAAKLDNYQNFAKAFRVEDYARVMGSMAANKAQLKRIPEFASRDLTESNEIGSTWLGHLIIGLQQLLTETDPQAVISQLQADLPDFMEIRALLIDVLTFIEHKAPEKATRDVSEVLGARLRNMRAIGN